MDSTQLVALLKKYIRYVDCAEGTDFVLVHDYRHECAEEVQFTDEEWTLVTRLAQENEADQKAAHEEWRRQNPIR